MSTSSYIAELISQNKDLWETGVSHQFMDDICNDTLSVDRFRDFLTQVRFISHDGVRGLLCRLLADTHDPNMVKNITAHVQALQSDGEHFTNVGEALKALGVTDPTSEEKMPATEAICDYFFKIGVLGTCHEKLLAITTFVELSNARFEAARKKGKIPNNPITSKWFHDHSQAAMNPWLHYLRTALDASVAKGTTRPSSHSGHTDKTIFRRVIQWTILVCDSSTNRGIMEWPESKFYHKGELTQSSARIRGT